MTTNHNESISNILFDMAPKKGRHSLDTIKLAAALSVIRYNDGYKAVHNIFQRFCAPNHFIRTKEAFRLLDKARSTNRRENEWQDTFAGEQTRDAKVIEQRLQYGVGYSSGMYSGAKSVVGDLHDSGDEMCSDDNI